jgi:hypothetical protein
MKIERKLGKQKVESRNQDSRKTIGKAISKIRKAKSRNQEIRFFSIF